MKKDYSVRGFAEIIKQVLYSDRDFILCLSGGTGEGKSTLSIQLAKEVDPNFNIEKNLAFTRKATVNKIKTLPRYSCLVVDEAINILFRRDFMVYKQKELLRLLDMCRDRNLCLIFNIPYVWSLDSHILQSRLRAWIYVQRRGVGALFMPDKNPFIYDAWHRRHNEKISKKSFVRSKNFVQWVSFQKLSDDEMKEYLRVKADKRGEVDAEFAEELFSKKDAKKIVLASIVHYTYWLKEKGILPYGKMAEIERLRGMKRSDLYKYKEHLDSTIQTFTKPLIYI